jgi:ribonuclease P protein component
MRCHDPGAQHAEMTNFSFQKTDRIREKSEFKDLYNRGKRIKSDAFIVCYLPNTLQRSRLGMSVSRKVGCAVIRNRIKRIAREVFRLQRSRFFQKGSWDIHLIARNTASRLSTSELVERLVFMLNQLESRKNSF